jgi:hypothetical protein
MGDNIGRDLRELEWEDVNWIRLAHDRDQWRAVVNKVMELRQFLKTESAPWSLFVKIRNYFSSYLVKCTP